MIKLVFKVMLVLYLLTLNSALVFSYFNQSEEYKTQMLNADLYLANLMKQQLNNTMIGIFLIVILSFILIAIVVESCFNDYEEAKKK